MPIYEYRCRDCGFQKEFLQRMSDAPLTDCPNCGKPALAKMVSAAGFKLKGTGWYATDFKGSGSKPAAKQDSPGASAQDKPAAAQDKPADGSTKKDSSTTEPSPSTSATSG
jgi:putative FmdB family regulatory protein